MLVRNRKIACKPALIGARKLFEPRRVSMGLAEILVSIDREITTLQRARKLLVAQMGEGKKRGRPPAATLKAQAKAPAKKRKKRNLTPEGRKRIADAQKRRWEASRKSAASPR
jgi:hypothetical protein